MKTAEIKTSHSNPSKSTKGNQPFFNKGGEGSFFSKEAPQQDFFFSPSTIQPKLTIGAPNDPYEQEADAMAEKVVQQLAVGSSAMGSPQVQMKCAACEEEEKVQKKEGEEEEVMPKLQKKAIFESNEEQPKEAVQMKSEGGASEASPDLESRLGASRGGGQALPEGTRSSMESAFGADFSGVRVHTGSESVQMNKELGAQAFTHGSDVYFGAGKYDARSREGQRLLGHELTHVVQQGATTGLQKKAIVQLSCGPAAIGSPTGCTPISGNLNGERFLYTVNCDTPAVGQEFRLRAFAMTIANNETIDIHGFSSVDGDPVFNESLSCARAKNAAEIIRHELNSLGVLANINIFMHGATEGERAMQRSVVIDRKTSYPEAEDENAKKCGPDVTAWLIAQMTANGSGSTATELRRLNNSGNPLNWTEALIRWAWLVRTGGIWDFKTVLDGDISSPFPACRRNCTGKMWSITLKGTCMTYEAVANIHYGYVGRMAGFSESRLLSGASGAQAGEGRGETTDAPNDVEAIQVGFSLFDQRDPSAFTAADLPANHYDNLPEGDGDTAGCEPCDSVYSG
jgi:Domain of unknown function (DUF4157)/Bacterial toxin 44